MYGKYIYVFTGAKKLNVYIRKITKKTHKDLLLYNYIKISSMLEKSINDLHKMN